MHTAVRPAQIPSDTARKSYTPPQIIYDLNLETRAGSTLSVGEGVSPLEWMLLGMDPIKLDGK